jgi:voltage-gated potassium channel
MMENNRILPTKNNKLNITIVVFIITSVIIVFVDYLFPLSENQRLSLRIFDLIIVVILAADFIVRLRSSEDKLKFMLRHSYEFPAMIPLLVTGTLDDHTLFYYVRFIALFRVVRLYNIMSYIEGSEVIALASVSAVTIIFGAFGIYLAESGRPDSNINNMYDALWWSIETITTVAYGEYYPVTVVGRIISSLMMFAAIAFLWTFIGILGLRIVAKRVKEKENGNSSKSHTILLDKTKEFIKSKVDEIERIDDDDLETLLKVIRSLKEKNIRSI